MSASMINFESASEKEEQRKREKKARQAILEKVQHEHEVRKQQQEMARQRGEHTWMLPSVEARLAQDPGAKKKKKKNKKKTKKEKKSHKSKRRSSSTSSSSSDEEAKEKEAVWVEKTASKSVTSSSKPPGPFSPSLGGSSGEAVKRDGWMEMTSLFGTFSREEMRERDGTSRIKAKEEEEKRKREALKSLEKFNKLLAEAEGRETHRKCGSVSQNLKEDRRIREICRRSKSNERDGKRNRSSEKEKERSRSRDKKKSREIDRSRSRSRGRQRSRSTSQEWERGGEDRKDRSRRDRRNRSEEKRSRRRHREKLRKSSSSSSSDSSRSHGSRNRSKLGDGEKYHPREEKLRFSQKLLKPSDEVLTRATSSGSFLKPEDNRSMQQPAFKAIPQCSGSNRWQKKEHRQPIREKEEAQRQSSSPSSSPESSSSEETAPAGQGEVPFKQTASLPLTDKEMNELAAKIMKAELMGNEVQATKLKTKLEEARAVRAAGVSVPEEDDDPIKQVVVLTRTDSKGVSRPVMGVMGDSTSGKKKKKMKTHGQDGLRARYFPDDDQRDLKTMFEREKGTTADDHNALFENAVMRNFERLDDEYAIDDMFMSKAAVRNSATQQAEMDRKKAIQEHNRIEKSLEACQWCFDNKEMPKHLIVALGTKCYVSLPAHKSLTPGHCCIIPIHHVACSVQADEDLWGEVQSFRKSLVKMFASRGEDCIFFETLKKLRHFPHMVLQCVPLPRETGDLAPIYFKKAIQECEGEWAQNKKLVELKGRDVRHAIPKGLPYFFVDFAMESGFAHVIEDEQDFPSNFAQEIVGGMLDLENSLWRKPRRENFDAQRRKVMEFSRWYKEFDPTQEDRE